MDKHLKAAAEFIENTGILARTDIIPSLNAEMASADVSFDEILTALSDNKVLAKKVLAVANSAWFASRVKIESVEYAFARLGINEFYSVVLTATLRHGFGEGPPANLTWAHAEMTARVCQLLAQHFSEALVELAFATGLLHDCAVPLMVKSLTNFENLVKPSLGCGLSVNQLEEERFEFNHAQVGAVLVEAWQFPVMCARAIEFHHRGSLAEAPEGEARRLLALLILAERVAAVCSCEIMTPFDSKHDTVLVGEIAEVLDADLVRIYHVIDEAVRMYSIRLAHL
ncbi:MAG: HDOD domain-containing protein [Verrucomicrobia bacterium]|nr:HDOD domain-containing protein [Verrucomicrobiota bacterium]